MPLQGGQGGGIFYGSGRPDPGGQIASQAILQSTALQVRNIQGVGQALAQAAVRIGDNLRKKRQEEDFREQFDGLQEELKNENNFQTIEARPVDHLPPGANPLADHINAYGGDTDRALSDWLPIAMSDPSMTRQRATYQFNSMVNPQSIRIPTPGRADELRQKTALLMSMAQTPAQRAAVQSMVGAQSSATVPSAGAVPSYLQSIWGKNFENAPGKVDQVAVRQAAEERKSAQKADALGVALLGLKEHGLTGESGARLAQLAREDLMPYASTIRQSKAAGTSPGVYDEQFKVLATEGKQVVDGLTFIAPGQEGPLESDIQRIAANLGLDPNKVRDRAMGEIFTGETLLQGTRDRLDQVIRPVRGPGADGAHIPIEEMASDPSKPVSASHALLEWSQANPDELQGMIERKHIVSFDAEGLFKKFDLSFNQAGEIVAKPRYGGVSLTEVGLLNEALGEIKDQIAGGIRASQGTVRKSTAKERAAVRQYTHEEMMRGDNLK